MVESINRAGTKAAFREVLEAIRTLKSIEHSGRKPGHADKELMSRFSGFGAYATKVFPDPVTGQYAEGWEELGEALRELLTDAEYISAKATTFTAFYTSEVVTGEMYRALEQMGVGLGCRGLEPGCGVGNFIKTAPVGIDFIGVEQDSLSGRMARQIHDGHDIRVEDFEDTQLPEGSVDFVVGNVPFADLKLRYRGQRHSLHDYFFLKSLDAVRPGGVMALVTSRYTLDKASPKVRELLAEQADLVGAVRLPGGAFRDQGTNVVTDIVFLRKRPRELEAEKPSWVDDRWINASKTAIDGGEAVLNDYFQAHPEMVLGEMSVGPGMYGDSDLRVRSDGELAAALHAAMDGLPRDVLTPRTGQLAAAQTIAADPNLPEGVQEGSLFIAADKTIMQVVSGQAEAVTLRGKPLKSDGTTGGKRLAQLIELKHKARAVLKAQQEGKSTLERDAARSLLRQSYANFKRKHGPINKTTLSERDNGTVTRRMPNLLRFRTDPDVYLVMALENYDERTGEATPATIMERDVVTPPKQIESVASAKEGLVASLNLLSAVDIAYISSLYGKGETEIIDELGDLIFFDPALDCYVPADEYLSGNVRGKLRLAEASDDPRTAKNAKALEAALPEDLVATEIDVTLGTPWIPAADVQAFLAELFGAGAKVEYVAREALWKISGGNRSSAAAVSEFGTEDVNAYTLAEQALNMRSPTVRRVVPGGPGESDTYVVDQEATIAARTKQAELKEQFARWAFEDPARSARLVKFYNENFNNIRLRKFDGSHLTFPRMSASITMRPHQKDAIWRNVASGNTLLAHVVGAGKTFTMIASGMEMKRMGLANKPLFVVPNHMLEQFSREYLVLYPDANILVATKQDLTKSRRQLLKSRMATGDWNGIVMTHSSFEKIAMSPEFQEQFLAQQIGEYEELLTTIKDKSLNRNVTKKIEKLKASRKAKLKDMAEGSGKDGGLFFDELGIDQVFIDEAHMYKNLETPTKMDRVAGVQTGGSNRAFDLFMKARYLHSRTPGRGLTFATGTPVSNSLGELYTMMRYLMPEELAERGIGHFDSWAAAFGEVINSLEISPDGQSLRVNTRFAKFKNLPELLSMFRMTADVQTAAMLKLPVPKLKGGKAQISAAEMTEWQKDYQQDLVDRYEHVRSGGVKPYVDNALKIVNDGRKLALDARLVDRNATDNPNSKVNQLVDRVFSIWEGTADERSTQMIFSDLGVKPTEWGFSVYDDVIEKLVARGVPRDEIANIGHANTDAKKEVLFSQVRSGQVRILLGSTAKMGTGTNVQKRLVALHHLDPPWRPADIEQRDGRILRQGNENDEVEVIRYVTEGSFDAYMWQTLETKARFIAQAMAGDAGTRRADDIGGAELSFAEVKAIASGNPAMLTLAEIDMNLRQLKMLRNAHSRDQAQISAKVQQLPDDIAGHVRAIAALEEDTSARRDIKGDAFSIKIGGSVFTKQKGENKTARQRAQGALELAVAKAQIESKGRPIPWQIKVAEIGGLDVVLVGEKDRYTGLATMSVNVQGASVNRVSTVQTGQCPKISEVEHTLTKGMDRRLAEHRASHDKLAADLERYTERAGTPFPSEGVYQQLRPLRDALRGLLRKQEKDDGLHVDAQIAEVVEAYQALDIRGSTAAPEVHEEPETAAPAESAAISERELAVDEPEEPDELEQVAAEDDYPDGAIVLISDEYDDEPGICWFHLAEKQGEIWSIQSVYPEHSRPQQAFEPRRKGYGVRDEGWVLERLADDDMLVELAEHLNDDETARLIPAQRVLVEAAAEEQQAEAHAVVEPAPQPQPQSQPAREPRAERPREIARIEPVSGTGQMGLFDAPPSPAEKPSPRVAAAVAKPIRGTQISLFGEVESPRRQTAVAETLRPAAKEVRFEAEPENDGPSEEELDRWMQEEEEMRGSLDPDDPLWLDPNPEETRKIAAPWQESLSPRERGDVTDCLEHDPDRPTEAGVVGSFTMRLADRGDRTRISDIIHSAMERYEPFNSMVERIERETGRRPDRADDRGARAIYNATLARRSGMGRELR